MILSTNDQHFTGRPHSQLEARAVRITASYCLLFHLSAFHNLHSIAISCPSCAHWILRWDSVGMQERNRSEWIQLLRVAGQKGLLVWETMERLGKWSIGVVGAIFGAFLASCFALMHLCACVLVHRTIIDKNGTTRESQEKNATIFRCFAFLLFLHGVFSARTLKRNHCLHCIVVKYMNSEFSTKYIAR